MPQRDQEIHLVSLDSLGRFNTTFHLLNPQEIMFKFGNSLVGFFAVPGSKDGRTDQVLGRR
ncbi:MAG: hypothetical protein FWJ85_11060 [Solitalea sp.]